MIPSTIQFRKIIQIWHMINMRHSNQSAESSDSKSSTSEPTKRYNSLQFQTRLKNSQLSHLNTSRFSGDIACAFHNDQKITNFCKNKQCLLPLCPKCVGIHCQQHSKRGVFGDFVTVDDSITEVSHNLKVILGKLDNTQKWMQRQKCNFDDKENRLNINLAQVKHVFLQKIKALLQNFEQAVRNICTIQASAQVQQLNQVQEFKDILLSNCNTCFKKLMSPSERLQGLIHYYYHEQQFSQIDAIQNNIEKLMSNRELSIDLSLQKTNLLQSTLKGLLLPSKQQQEIWSEFKVLNSKSKSYRVSKDNLESKGFISSQVNLDNFVSPLSQFSLQQLRGKSIQFD